MDWFAFSSLLYVQLTTALASPHVADHLNCRNLTMSDYVEVKIGANRDNPWCNICGHKGPLTGMHSCFGQLGVQNWDYDLAFLFRAGFRIQREAFRFFLCQRTLCDNNPIRVNRGFSYQQNQSFRDCQVFESRCKQIQDWFFPQMRQQFIYGKKHKIIRLNIC